MDASGMTSGTATGTGDWRRRRRRRSAANTDTERPAGGRRRLRMRTNGRVDGRAATEQRRAFAVAFWKRNELALGDIRSHGELIASTEWHYYCAAVSTASVRTCVYTCGQLIRRPNGGCCFSAVKKRSCRTDVTLSSQSNER